MIILVMIITQITIKILLLLLLLLLQHHYNDDNKYILFFLNKHTGNVFLFKILLLSTYVKI